MCPSYMVTLEEEHSTRGRAHMLFEMLQGEVLQRRLAETRTSSDALDLCLSCKACKSECPTNVDIATYRAEFLVALLRGPPAPAARVRVRHDRSWARSASLAPGLANARDARAGLEQLIRADARTWRRSARCRDWRRRASRRWARSAASDAGGDAARRGGRAARSSCGRTPSTTTSARRRASAALEVLRAAGLRRQHSRADTCAAAGRCTTSACSTGRSGICSTSWTSSAPQIDAGMPIVVLEPSCASVFRDELRNLFPDDAARRPAAEADLAAERVPRARAPGLSSRRSSAAKVLLHGHCHHKAIMKMTDEESLLRKMGAEVQCARRRLLRHGRPVRLRGATNTRCRRRSASACCCRPCARRRPTPLIVADGFSCREQIEQATGRRAIHLAEAMRNALK